MRQTRNLHFLQIIVGRLAEAIYWLRRTGYIRQQAREHHVAIHLVIDRLNRFRIEDCETTPSSCTADPQVSSSESEEIGKLESPIVPKAEGRKPMNNSSGSGNQSPEREKDNGSRSRGRSENPHTEDRGRARSQHHYYYRSRSKNNVIIDKLRGKTGEDVERFLRAVQRSIDKNLETGRYNSEEEQNTDHVALINRHCGSRVREYIRSLKGNWEEEPLRVKEALICRYRTFGENAINGG